MKKLALTVLMMLAGFQGGFARESPGTTTAAEALQKLKEGNQRAAADQPIHPSQSLAQRAEVAKGQHPFAIIVGCSDSRVSPELVFDQGLGDLFVIRVAGNVIDDHALGSIEYAVEHLGTPLIVVLGHERCGAVDATVKGGHAGGHIKSLIEAIKPAVAKVLGKEGDLLENAIKENAKGVAETVSKLKPILEPLISAQQVKVVVGYYDLESGVVEFSESNSQN